MKTHHSFTSKAHGQQWTFSNHALDQFRKRLGINISEEAAKRLAIQLLTESSEIERARENTKIEYLTDPTRYFYQEPWCFVTEGETIITIYIMKPNRIIYI